jgi:hypothetical protein
MFSKGLNKTNYLDNLIKRRDLMFNIKGYNV